MNTKNVVTEVRKGLINKRYEYINFIFPIILEILNYLKRKKMAIASKIWLLN
jgi:hypothetical protein